MSKRLLVVEAHSDDSAIGAYGLIRKLLRQGYEAFFVVVTVSDMEFLHCGLVTAAQRRGEYANYVKSVGGMWLQGDLPLDADAKLDQVEKRILVGNIEKIIASVRPNILICQAPSFHHDHTITYEATIAAMRPTVKFCPDEVLLMENPTYVHSLGPGTDFKPTTYCELSEDDMGKKLECFTECFPTQMRERENSLSPEGIKTWAKYRGLECRAEHYAEAFMTYMRKV